MMKTVLILTKTNWDEAPRIRHQVTRLLIKKGFKIIFVEKNTYRSVFIKTREEEGITFFSHSELIHHQLRYFPFIQKLNNLVVKFYLAKIIKKIEFDFILNFSYEYSFLKEIAPNKKLVTMIEDDFETQAKFGMAKQIRNQVKATCKSSDFVLTVSYPLYNKLTGYKSNVTLLFPWSQNNYKRPIQTIQRTTVLYFGYVGRLNWKIIEDVIKNSSYHFRFIGPTNRAIDRKMIGQLNSRCSNFEYISYKSFEDLDVSDVFCSILPYDTNLESVQQCTVSNRVFNLLSLGIPLVYANLQSLIQAPSTIIRKNNTANEYIKSIEYFENEFYSIQGDIETFIKEHYQNNRWLVLEEIINQPLKRT